MNVLKSLSKAAAMYFKPQGVNPQGTYRLMRYILQSGSRFYHLVTGEVIELEADALGVVSQLPVDYDPRMDELIRHYFLVENDFDEKDWVDFLRAAGRVMFDPPARVPHYVIMPTTFCNARCDYCFQQDMKRETMTDEVVEETVDFIAKTVAGRVASITWYGGEPLVGSKIIDKICSGLKSREVSWQSYIVTNAYLADSAAVKKMAVQWQVKKAQITLDGTEADYNRIKTYCSATAGSPYQRVLNHIEGILAEGIAVLIRMNIGKDNGDSLLSLAEELCSRFKNADKLSFSAAILSGLQITAEERRNLQLTRRRIRQVIQEQGFYAGNSLIALRMHCCTADSPESVVILPDGRIGKCYMYPEKDSGLLSDGKWPAAYGEKYEDDRCAACILYPDCFRLRRCYVSCPPEYAEGRIADMLSEMVNI